MFKRWILGVAAALTLLVTSAPSQAQVYRYRSAYRAPYGYYSGYRYAPSYYGGYGNYYPYSAWSTPYPTYGYSPYYYAPYSSYYYAPYSGYYIRPRVGVYVR